MGQGGTITLSNLTDQDWHLVHSHSYQMNAWSFPEVIPKLTASQRYVEWDQHLGRTQSDDAGEARYAIGNTGKTFELQARAKDGFNLQVDVSSFQQPPVVRLGWVHDGDVDFHLYGEGGWLGQGFRADRWMSGNLALLGPRPLRRICMPGSHDAGMSRRTGGTPLGTEHATLTQTLDIGGQFDCGSRFFDLRPVIGDGEYKTGHYSKVLLNWQGANGQSIAEIVGQLNARLDASPELVILYSQGSTNTEVGNASYRPFTDDEWRGYFDALKGLRHRLRDDAGGDLTTRPLRDFIGGGRGCVLVFVKGASQQVLDEYRAEGIFGIDSMPIYDSYADTDDAGQMISDQIAKMRAHKTAPGSEMFLLSWTLTLKGAGNVFGPSIIDLAERVRARLYGTVLNEATPQSFPNVIYVDAFNEPALAALAMAVNRKVAG